VLSSPLETKFLTSRRLLGAGCNHKQSKLLLTTCRIAGALIRIGCYSRFSPAMASEEACRHGSWIFKVQRHQPLRLICDLPFLLEAPHSSSYLGWNWKTIPKRKRKLF
jgi:hypothetical protein